MDGRSEFAPVHASMNASKCVAFGNACVVDGDVSSGGQLMTISISR